MATMRAKGIFPCWEMRGCPIMITHAVRITTVYLNYITVALIISKDQAVRITLFYFSYRATTLVISNALSC